MLQNATTGYQGRVLRLAASGEPAEGPDLGAAPGTGHGDGPADDARRQAVAIVAAARAEADQILEQAKLAAEAELAGRLAALDRAYRADMDAIRPRLAGVVRRAVEEILDQTPDEALAEGALRRALRDLPDRGVTLRCAPGSRETGLDLVRRLETQGADVIAAVAVDPDLAPGAWRLETGGVAVEVGRRTQLALLEQALSGAIDAAGVRAPGDGA